MSDSAAASMGARSQAVLDEAQRHDEHVLAHLRELLWRRGHLVAEQSIDQHAAHQHRTDTQSSTEGCKLRSLHLHVRDAGFADACDPGALFLSNNERQVGC